MIRDALRRIAGEQQSAANKDGGYAAAQNMIAYGKHRDQKYGYMYGNYYEKKARKKAQKLYGDTAVHGGSRGGPYAPSHGGGSSVGAAGGYSSAQNMIEEGKRRDRKYGRAYGNYYEQRARKKAADMHELY